MIDTLNDFECTGCASCANICPQKCIDMAENQEGFLYPKIDKKKCISCNLCEKACPYFTKVENNNYNNPIIKAAWSLNDEIRLNSTSGGIFSELAEIILSMEGCVIGARYNDDKIIEHYIIDKREEIPLLRQSKYAQSNKNDIYVKIKELLTLKKKVLFVGTPCEVSGLKTFLTVKKINGDNLILCDFICLGVNSPKVYRLFLQALEKKYCSKVKKVWFKNKTYGWNNFSTRVDFENQQIYLKNKNEDYFMRGFIGANRLYMRLSCTECKYKTLPRISDITLADFWGIAEKNIALDADKGTSMIMLNSDKGKELFHLIKPNVFSADCSLEDVVRGNGALFESVKASPKRQAFFSELDNLAFDCLIDKYCKDRLGEKVKNLLYRIKNKLFCK